MLTIATIKLGKEDGNELTPIDVDLDDSGWVYLKQDNDWVALPLSKLGDLVKVLESIDCD
jgi:hypothetical protein